ncbi:hypothetical protein CWI42_020860 [Ordospora colligata]|uniref:Uncharacterized protein n=1 Tax=Ordospora colligata OC4 TaxID=1354746 RepID=A0A0B2UMU4_9MICR|nr:uncharacterized protein M896_020870 [Ordospora colligata OC4]KHN70250.1 hypothetical protein M896_020870 [Ordospora colligata OC4]TBU16794.1 hypothetical protein CWI41_020880 [Ordospora colligata]TBU16902.1 hypothetical protein CWI40_020880 [Ordospora colligata]TBU19343.1 hypothetical protein CWI42_020860 [Ordospora colligata]
MSGECIRKLGKKSIVADYEKIVNEYEMYRKFHIDNLAYVDENMLMVYECAFFFHCTGIKYSNDSEMKINQKIYKAALNEIKQKYVRNKIDVYPEIKEDDGIVCNLYSICR